MNKLSSFFRLKIHRKLHINLHRGTAERPLHGPQVWPWWRLFCLAFFSLNDTVHKPSTGYRLWVYTKGGAWYFDLFFDRRDLSDLNLK